jgi:hypothetical protein
VPLKAAREASNHRAKLGRLKTIPRSMVVITQSIVVEDLVSKQIVASDPLVWDALLKGPHPPDCPPFHNIYTYISIYIFRGCMNSDHDGIEFVPQNNPRKTKC